VNSLKSTLESRFQALRNRLSRVDQSRVDSRFVGDDGTFAPQGQAMLNNTMEECYALVYEMQTA
jgi:hypothetical protein